MTPDRVRFGSFAEFYPFYLSEHQNRTSRRLHVIGTGLVLCCLFYGVLVNWHVLLAMPFVGYGFAWVGHYVFERNRPATFRHPAYSLLGDFCLFQEVVTGRRRF